MKLQTKHVRADTHIDQLTRSRLCTFRDLDIRDISCRIL